MEFKKESGLSCGLFLDQRDNRAWTQSVSANKNALNLFAYTGAFSVAAAIGGAQKVTTVDLSKNYIEWCKNNFVLNGLPIETHGFYAMDTMDYLKYAYKKELQFDLVICDPPSFSRDKKGNVFRVEKDFGELLLLACRVLSPNGRILFSTNYEKWTANRWEQELVKILKSEHLEITQKLSFQWDFETHNERHMKAFLLQKK
ncbi:MAG: class I SAM-dependent rRNA methyltransferase [Bdellovibrionaceae bacterium]|nr:class I SAM-dependent rRNA methyltransferase [Pseudobdellovibrionaceae bacterium]